MCKWFRAKGFWTNKFHQGIASCSRSYCLIFSPSSDFLPHGLNLICSPTSEYVSPMMERGTSLLHCLRFPPPITNTQELPAQNHGLLAPLKIRPSTASSGILFPPPLSMFTLQLPRLFINTCLSHHIMFPYIVYLPGRQKYFLICLYILCSASDYACHTFKKIFMLTHFFWNICRMSQRGIIS